MEEESEVEMEEGVRDGRDGGGCQKSSALSPRVDRGVWHPGLTGLARP